MDRAVGARRFRLGRLEGAEDYWFHRRYIRAPVDRRPLSHEGRLYRMNFHESDGVCTVDGFSIERPDTLATTNFGPSQWKQNVLFGYLKRCNILKYCEGITTRKPRREGMDSHHLDFRCILHGGQPFPGISIPPAALSFVLVGAGICPSGKICGGHRLQQ